jgi:proteic killer suppression protein
MIISFGNKATEALFNGIHSKNTRHLPSNINAVTFRKLDMINAALSVEDLKSPPGNRLEQLSGDLKGFYSIRINSQFRLIFKFAQGNASEVSIIDYH